MELDELGAAQQRMALAVRRVAEVDDAFRRRFRGRATYSAMEFSAFTEDMQRAGEELARCCGQVQELLAERAKRQGHR